MNFFSHMVFLGLVGDFFDLPWPLGRWGSSETEILRDGLAMVQIEGVGDVRVSSHHVVELEEPAVATM